MPPAPPPQDPRKYRAETGLQEIPPAGRIQFVLERLLTHVEWLLTDPAHNSLIAGRIVQHAPEEVISLFRAPHLMAQKIAEAAGAQSASHLLHKERLHELINAAPQPLVHPAQTKEEQRWFQTAVNPDGCLGAYLTRAHLDIYLTRHLDRALLEAELEEHWKRAQLPAQPEHQVPATSQETLQSTQCTQDPTGEVAGEDGVSPSY